MSHGLFVLNCLQISTDIKNEISNDVSKKISVLSYLGHNSTVYSPKKMAEISGSPPLHESLSHGEIATISAKQTVIEDCLIKGINYLNLQFKCPYVTL